MEDIMKKILALTILTASLNALSADVDKYCMPYLEGKIEGQSGKPALLTGFDVSKGSMEVSGKMVDSIKILPSQSDLKGNSKTKNTKEGEEVEIEIMKFKQNGKKVLDYTLVINRDKAGNLLSIAKKPVVLQDFKMRAESLSFRTLNGVCMPEKFVVSNKLHFNVTLCRAIDQFWIDNPAAKGCLDAKYDKKLAGLIKEHLSKTSEEDSLNTIIKYEDKSQMFAGQHRGNCITEGVESIVKDDALWIDGAAKKEDKKPDAKEE